MFKKNHAYLIVLFLLFIFNSCSNTGNDNKSDNIFSYLNNSSRPDSSDNTKDHTTTYADYIKMSDEQIRSELDEKLKATGGDKIKMDSNARISVPEIRGNSACDLFATVIHHSDGPRPTILTATPYRRELWLLVYYSLVLQGYNLVSVDVRGTGDSHGQWTILGKEDHTDLAYIIDTWIPSQPWSDGKIGMIGASYQGANQILVSGHIELGPDGTPTHLKALMPLVPMGDPYSNLMMKGGNCHWLGVLVYFGGVDIMSLIPFSHLIGISTGEDISTIPGIDDAAELSQVFSEHLKSFDMHFSDWMCNIENLNNTELWRERSTTPYFPDKYGSGWELEEGAHSIPSKLPTFIVGGWWCLIERGAINNYQHGLKQHAPGDRALIMGPWYHLDGGIVTGLDGLMFKLDVAARWFDWKIKGKADSFMVEYPVLLYVLGEDRWRAEKAWPLPASRVEKKTWYLSKQHHAGIFGDWFSLLNYANNYILSQKDASSNYSGTNPVLIHEPSYLHGLMSHSLVRMSMGIPSLIDHIAQYELGQDLYKKPFWEDERSDEVGVLTFTTGELDDDLEIAGPLKLTFWAKTKFHKPLTNSMIDSSVEYMRKYLQLGDFLMLDYLKRKDVQWVVEVNDVYSDGQAKNITSGWLAASHRAYDPNNKTGIDPSYEAFDPFYYQSELNPDLIEEDVLYKYVVEILWTDIVFKKGHRIRLSISGSDFPHLLPFLPPSSNTIVIDAQHKATLEFCQANKNNEDRDWKWVDRGKGSIRSRFQEANSYLLNHTN
jgi:putative CocE/NonD family hydrolase